MKPLQTFTNLYKPLQTFTNLYKPLQTFTKKPDFLSVKVRASVLILTFVAGLLWLIPGSASNHQPHLLLRNSVKTLEMNIRKQNNLTRELFSYVQQIYREIQRLERENQRLKREVEYIKENKAQRSHQRRHNSGGYDYENDRQ